jgi:signal transduction histidine kinase
MKMRTQFILLVAGIIVVPFLVTASVLLLRYVEMRLDRRSGNPPEVASWGRRTGPLSTRLHDLEDLARRLPPGSDIVVFGPNNTILFSTVPLFVPGKPASQDQILRFIRENARSSLFHIDSPRAGEAGELVLLLRMPQEPEQPPWIRRRTMETVVYTSLALLFFSSLTSFLIVRRFNLAILKLEGATRKIAGGDLDFQLSAPGRDEISSLTRSFDTMRRALKEEQARRSRLIMGISHDLKTPLALIQGYVEAIADGFASDPQAQKRYLSIISDKARALDTMVTQLIEFVRMETGEWRLTFREVHLRRFLQEIAERYVEDALILKREFGSVIELPEELTVPMDEALVGRALENLIGNAIRYTDEGGRVEMTADTDGKEAMLRISDTGMGIPQEDLDRIFDPFFRATNSRREQGMGLGLAVVKSIIEGQGWHIEVASEVARGTTFTIRIPLVRKTAGRNRV